MSFRQKTENLFLLRGFLLLLYLFSVFLIICLHIQSGPKKSDVYSFGVVLMELVSGKKPLELEYGESIDIVKWVCSRDSALLSVVDSRIPEVLKEEAVRVLKVAKLCTETLPNLRPTMRTVVEMLKKIDL
uniref:Serine-threonine/tyrosine-protein kinase catalytic domain-containing protein n=1 Tax=Quercus lobata TaxID=97700 RepID=A0A7N2RF32_QUELO